MTDNGEAYMQMEKKVATTPQKSMRWLPRSARRETAETTPNIAKMETKSAPTLTRSFLEAYTRKTTTYTNSMTAPVPLMVVTRTLLGDTNGSPYL